MRPSLIKMRHLCLGALVFCALGSSVEGQGTNDLPVSIFSATFSGSTGKPQLETQVFPLPSMVHAPFRLIVENGNSSAANRASSATLGLNGTELLGPSDFNQDISTIEMPVSLLQLNTLTVELRSKPGSVLKVSVVGE